MLLCATQNCQYKQYNAVGIEAEGKMIIVYGKLEVIQVRPS